MTFSLREGVMLGSCSTRYRAYLAAQLGQLTRIMALKEPGLSLPQARHGRGRDQPRPGFRPAKNIVPVVNELEAQFDQLGIYERVKEAGPRVIFYEHEHGEDVTVVSGVPVARSPQGLPAPAHYRVRPEIEAAVAVRTVPRPASTRWCTEERGYRPVPGPGRDVWVHEVDDIADVDRQVFEIQLPFTRPEAAGEN